ncbi:hypothetical protein B9Q00_09510, partial [Candidatus Marsarchaeota G1 archaeon OSP_C]
EKDLTEVLSNQADTKPSSTLLDQVIRIIGAKSWVAEKQLQEPPLNLINLRNGILDIETGQLHPHNPQLWFTSVIDVEYNPNAECPNFLKFLSEILPLKRTQQYKSCLATHSTGAATRAAHLC